MKKPLYKDLVAALSDLLNNADNTGCEDCAVVSQSQLDKAQKLVDATKSKEYSIARDDLAIAAEVMAAYSDCHLKNEADGYKLRNLNFRASRQVSRDSAIAILKKTIPHGYNEFDAELLAKLPEDAQIVIGREGSPCIYIWGSNKLPIMKRMKADECDFYPKGQMVWMTDKMQENPVDQTRIWWD